MGPTARVTGTIFLRILSQYRGVSSFYHCIPTRNTLAKPFNSVFTPRYFSTSLRTLRMTKADGNRMNWKITADVIQKSTDDLITKTRAIYDAVGACKGDAVTFDSVIQPLIDMDREYSVERNNVDFVQHVFPDKDLRECSMKADKKLSEFDVEMTMRQDVFDALETFQKKGMEGLTPEVKRYIERQIKMGRRNGLHLPKDKQDRIKAIKKRMSDIEIDFSTNLNEEKTVLEFTVEELDGLPEDFIKSLDKTDEGKCKVTLKYPHYFPCMKKARNPETRKRLEIGFNSRCVKENTPILEELIKLRSEKAAILDFPTHAAFVLDMRMAKSPEKVKTFLEELAEKVKPLKEKDMQTFLQYKKEDCEKYGYKSDDTINMWDFRYYMTMVEEKKYAVDQNKLKEYFPMDVVTKGLLEIYQELLNLKFEQVNNAETWHEDVTMYSVTDKSSSKLLGYFYLDLYPREGKYGHAACFGLQPGCIGGNGERMISVAAMVANFTKPTADKPSLLQHDEVETYFHEFGHVMHQICAQSELAFFRGIETVTCSHDAIKRENMISGTNVERDFVEAPSQMLENWCWEQEPLNRMSKHYKDGTPIPEDILTKLINSRKANAGVFNMRQILLGTFDQTIHTRTEADTASLFSELSEKLLGFPSTPGTNMPASFGHIAGGYDAQYYGYMWSEVFCMDMFASRFKKEGVMNPATGADYRKYILQPGGSIDAADMLRNFLGRDPKPDAFLISKGLQPDSNL